jgi:general secretion pathway protein B
MSYILEALKKAQAERQLGNAPTIHAPQPAQVAEPGAAASRKPLFIGLGAGALVVGLGALFLWQHGSRPAAPAAMPVAAQPPVPAVAPTVAPTAAAPMPSPAAPATLVVSAPPAPPHPSHAAEPPARATPPAARAGTDKLAAAQSAPAAAAPAATPPAPAAATPAAARSTAAPAAQPSTEDSLPYLHQLPDVIQRDIPRVSFGGYMYSANPADRLLLVDKTLRHEGEEVGPGLILEKLLPRAAVMNFRGIRYRVAY